MLRRSLSQLLPIPERRLILRSSFIMASRYQAIRAGGPFETIQIERSVPGAGEVLIRLKAVALNPIDWVQL